MRRVLVCIVFVLAMLSLPNLAKRATHGFRAAKLQLDFPFHPEWEPPPDLSYHEALKQPYSFIGRGAQSYVFASADGHYVIKLFRFDYPVVGDKVTRLFNACKMAYDDLREETGLLYIHLNLTPMGLPILRCTDAVGRSHRFDLNQTRFALQKRAQDFKQTLRAARYDPAIMKKRIDQFVQLLRSRTAKDILNTDPNLSRNFGFLDNQAVEFDFGSYQHVPEMNQTEEIAHYANRLRRWLKKNEPEWVAYLDLKLSERK